ncbi:MAG: NAD(P)H-hydrate dehydratase [Candidatus Zixiibacteriota bacterium]
MELVTVETMRQIDTAAITGSVPGYSPIPSLELMETAGAGVADAVWDDFFVDAERRRVAIFCGKGNNGGDGLVAARYLEERGCFVSVYLCGSTGELSPDARVNFEKLYRKNIKVHSVVTRADLPEAVVTDVIVEALLGSGASGAPKGLIRDVIVFLNEQDDPICAVDNPAGLDADTGEAFEDVIHATKTYAIALPKPGHFLGDGKRYAGEVRVVGIGIPDGVIESFEIRERLLTPEDVQSALPDRPVQAHKGDFGRLFLMVGSRGMTGAGALAASAAMRAGAGIALVGCPASLESVFEAKLNEVMTLGLPDDLETGAILSQGLSRATSGLAKANAALIGCGLGRHRETEKLIRELIPQSEVPFVLDADGINAMEGDSSALTGAHAPVILTPHPGEFARLTGERVAAEFTVRIEQARAAAGRLDAIVALKGSTTIVADPSGLVYVNPRGNSGMATAGSGDVLAGIIASFLAQGAEPLLAALAGVYVHSLSGDLAASAVGGRSLIAGDMIEYLPEVFNQLGA